MAQPGFLSLPTELFNQILTCLSATDLTRVSQTCQTLRRVALDDTLWRRLVQNTVPTPVQHLPSTTASDGESCTSFRDLYVSLQPYWFLPRHKIWFADTPTHGKLIVARYDARRGCIEAYCVTATRKPNSIGTLAWAHDTLVDYWTFDPVVGLDLNQPVLTLDVNTVKTGKHTSGLAGEITMHNGSNTRVTSAMLLSRALPQSSMDGVSTVWPPLTIPSRGLQRTHSSSPTTFHSTVKPRLPSEVSDGIFRLRQWIEFSRNFFPIPTYDGSGRVGETVTTYGTLPEHCYVPTKDKPWQGIWCGDYFGHGCEFLLITQPDEPNPLPEKARRAVESWPRTTLSHDAASAQGPAAAVAAEVAAIAAAGNGMYNQNVPPTSSAVEVARAGRDWREDETDAYPYKGRLEAIKLTGDPNVPRGEITFIAADLGHGGLVGHAQHRLFNDSGDGSPHSDPAWRGARIVKSVGHVAGAEFTNDEYIPSSLIMISEKRLAQYWQPFGHISFYQRVDVDRLLHL